MSFHWGLFIFLIFLLFGYLQKSPKSVLLATNRQLMVQPLVLIIEFREGLSNTLKQIASNKGALVDVLTNLDDVEKKSIPYLIQRQYYKLVIMNYQMVQQYQPVDMLALVKKNTIPYALIHTDLSLKTSPGYELYAFWSFKVTDKLKDDPIALFSELNEEFVLPPTGSLKFAL